MDNANRIPAERQTENPSNLNMDADKLAKLDGIIKTDHDNIGGIVIVRNGCIAHEKYYDGYGPDDTIHVASVTKSIVSALIGIAIDNGLIESTEQKILDFFPEYNLRSADTPKRTVTIRHLLTMTAAYDYDREPFVEMCTDPNWITFALDLLREAEGRGKFQYSSAGAHLLSGILRKTTGRSALDLANEWLFRPLGMKELPVYPMPTSESEHLKFLYEKHVTGWVSDPAGNSAGGWGLTLTPRDMACFGLLYLNGGMWDGRRILSEQWIKKSIAMNPNRYGYLWWLFGEEKTTAYAALGDGGNVIYCMPQKDLVIAIASKFVVNANDRFALIEEWILPAVLD